MKIYIKDLHLSLPVEQAVHEFIATWFPAIKTQLIQVSDRKHQLELDASHFVETFSDFCRYFRLYGAGSVLLGGAIMVAETAYRIQTVDKEAVAQLSTETLLKQQDFLDYLHSEKFESAFEDAVKPEKIHEADRIADEMLRMAAVIGELTFNKQLWSNVSKALKASELIIRSSLLVSINNAKNMQRFLTVKIKDQNKHAYIGFNATEEEYKLLDKWFNIPDLTLEKSDDSNDIGQVETLQDFLVWFNTLRLVIETELAHETILDELALLDFEAYSRGKKNVSERILQISSINTISKYEVRKKVVEYLFEMLNSRKNKANSELKEFFEFTLQNLHSQFDQPKEVYVLSLYQ